MKVSYNDEKHLAQLLSKGDHQAFHDIFMLYHRKTEIFLTGLVKSSETASDLTQDVFMKIWDNREKLSDINNLGAYIYVIARNSFYNYVESCNTQKATPSIENMPKQLSVTPYDELVAKDKQIMADMLIDKMPEQRRRIFILSREKGLSNAEIAEKLSISKKTVENHINMALKQLKETLLTLLFALFSL